MPAKSGSSWRRVLRTLHLWLGIALCGPFVLLGLTGTVLVVDRALGEDSGQPLHTAGGPPQPVAAIIEAAARAAPAGQQPSLYAPRAAPDGAATVRFRARGGPGAIVAIAPNSLAVLAVRPGAAGFIGWVHRLHAQLLIPGRDGRSLVGVLGMAMLMMGLSGLWIWWPRSGRWRKAFTVQRGARGARLHRELHGATGIWGFAVLFIVAASGVALAFPDTVAAAFGAAKSERGSPAASAPDRASPSDGRTVDIDRMIASAMAAVPGTSLRTVSLPTQSGQSYRIALTDPGADPEGPPTTVSIDARSGQVIEIRDPAAGPLGPRLVAWQHALHSGSGLGPIWRLLVAACGILPALFAVTGTSMWLAKRRTSRRRHPSRAYLETAA